MIMKPGFHLFYSLLFFAVMACASTDKKPPAQPEAQPLSIVGKGPEVLKIAPNGDISVRGKIVGTEPEAYATLKEVLTTAGTQLQSCQAELAKLRAVKK